MGPAEEAATGLINEKAGTKQFRELIEDIRLSFVLPPDRWLSCVEALASILCSDLDWIELRNRNSVKCSGTRCLVAGLTSGFSTSRPVYGEVKTATQPFIDWIGGGDDHAVVEFCWDVLAFWDRTGGGGNALEPIYELKHSGRLQGEISLQYIDLAVTLIEEAERMFRWEEERWELVQWQRDSVVYLGALSHSSHLVRAAGARATGQLFIGCAQSGFAVPPISELMSLIGGIECETPGVAGPFLHGAGWGLGDCAVFAESFNFRAWFLETLKNSAREPDVPHCISLEFHAHEYLSSDALAIEQLLHMGRKNLAVHTATESPENIDKLRGVLHAMAHSSDPEVSQAIRTYLEERRHHAGTEFLSERAFGI